MKGNRNRTDLHRQQIFWRRDKVLELSAQRQTEREIGSGIADMSRYNSQRYCNFEKESHREHSKLYRNYIDIHELWS